MGGTSKREIHKVNNEKQVETSTPSNNTQATKESHQQANKHNRQHATCNKGTRKQGNMQQATSNKQQATGNRRQQATGNMQQATGNRQHATGNRQHIRRLFPRVQRPKLLYSRTRQSDLKDYGKVE
ncbi:hypothetical protein Tco_1065148 [Tanacetum coccineum]